MRAKFRTEKKTIASEKQVAKTDFARCGMIIDRQSNLTPKEKHQ